MRKWFWLILLACLIGGAAGLAVSRLLPKMYEAQMTLYLVSPNSSDFNSVSGAQKAAKSFALLPQSDPALLTTLQIVGDRSLSPSQLSSMIAVKNDPNSQFVVIKVRTRDPKYAAQLANEITNQSIAEFQAASTDGGTSKQFVKQMLGKLQVDINTLEKELADAQSSPSPTSQTARIDQLDTSLSSKLTSYDQLLSTYRSMSGFQVTLLQKAQIPKDPAGLGPAPAVAIGMLAALIAIVAVILFIDQTNGILVPPTWSIHNNSLSTSIAIKGILAQGTKRNGDRLSEAASTLPTTQAALAGRCPRCNAELVPQAAFCPRCGSPLNRAPMPAMPSTPSLEFRAINPA